MIIFKNMLKVLLIALFVCIWSTDTIAQCNPPCKSNEICVKTQSNVSASYTDATDTYRCFAKEQEQEKEPDTSQVTNTSQDPSFCSSNQGIFSDLVKTGQTIFNRLRDLIYVVAGFGIIAVAVGGFFGNLNWKWLGAIVISLVVIATAGELIVLMTGCSTFSSSLITNTLSKPAPMTTAEFNETYTQEVSPKGYIEWEDSMDRLGVETNNQEEIEAEAEAEANTDAVNAAAAPSEGSAAEGS